MKVLFATLKEVDGIYDFGLIEGHSNRDLDIIAKVKDIIKKSGESPERESKKENPTSKWSIVKYTYPKLGISLSYRVKNN